MVTKACRFGLLSCVFLAGIMACGGDRHSGRASGFAGAGGGGTSASDSGGSNASTGDAGASNGGRHASAGAGGEAQSHPDNGETKPSAEAAGASGSGGDARAHASGGGQGGASALAAGAGGTGRPSIGKATLRGAVQKGPFVLGSSVAVSEVDASGSPSGQVYSTQTINDLGEFSVDFDYSGFVSLEASGFYYNELSGTLSGAQIVLRAFHEITISGTQTVFVNLVTHLSYNRVKALVGQKLSFDDASAQAETELRAGLEIGLPDFDPGKQGTSLNIAGGDTDANAYLFAVSAVVAKAAELRGGPLDARIQELVNTISAGLASDGTVRQAVVDELHEAQQALDTAAVEESFQARLDELGSDAEVPDIDRILDQDFDGQVNAEDCLPADPERWTGHADHDGDGHDHKGCGGDDCEDDHGERFPGNPEVCGNNVDEDCSGAANDADCDGHDSKADGGDDCDDGNDQRYPGNTEVCGNSVDEDCSGVANDLDCDGHDAVADGGDDCDDDNPDLFSGNSEVCGNGTDDNCDGLIDEGCPCPGTGGSAMIRLPEVYCIDSTEVTREQYQEWLATHPDPSSGQNDECTWNDSYEPTCEWPPGDKAEHPVVCVDWCDAYAYCIGVGKRLCGSIDGGASDFNDRYNVADRQWSIACSSSHRYEWPYGDSFQASSCNVFDHGMADTVPVASLPACQSPLSAYAGVFDMSGNVKEWEEACNGETGSSDHCLARGGSFADDVGNDYFLLDCSNSDIFDRNTATNDLGFRCCSP
ncbi:MAG: SUMF1/EgtB/PvdO family nonheme iron enzyme [Polyangiaceae bacterium]|nr:SUMF1/EgtB/PvdO family nonheme iron enzyme [Polyangiaceae bacterium]